MKKSFYKEIENYYDADSDGFDDRYRKNQVLQRIRQDFREEVKRFTFTNMLEIGYGTGLDLVHFGKTHPHVSVSGIDISSGMQTIALEKISDDGLNNVSAEKGKVEDLGDLYPGIEFDLIYVFFGALNTVDDLEKASEILYEHTSGGGVLVLSFVNKYYIAGMIIEMFKFRFRAAFARLRPEWGGYSPSRYLPSRCYSPRQVAKAFNNFKIIKRKGYSIIHPAWYYHRINRFLRKYLHLLWKIDKKLQKTFLWKYGEYTLFVLQKPSHVTRQATDIIKP